MDDEKEKEKQFKESEKHFHQFNKIFHKKKQEIFNEQTENACNLFQKIRSDIHKETESKDFLNAFTSHLETCSKELTEHTEPASGELLKGMEYYVNSKIPKPVTKDVDEDLEDWANSYWREKEVFK